MGCHTWFYSKINPQPTYKEVKENVLTKFKSYIDNWDKIARGEVDQEMLDAYPEWTPGFAKKQIEICKRTISFIEKDLCKKAVYNRYSKNDALTVSINCVLYEEVQYHDLFRKYDFPLITLSSLQETLDYIEENKDSIKTYDYTFEKLDEFWKEHPEGIIRFG